MRILIVHNSYQQVGGEDSVVEAERRLLVDHGHDINLFLVDNKDLACGKYWADQYCPHHDIFTLWTN